MNDVEPQPKDRPNPKRLPLLAVAVPIMLVLLLIGAATFATKATELADRHASAPPKWATFVQAGRQMATDLNSIDVATVDADVQRILDNSSGALHADYAQRAQSITEAARDAKSVTTGTVTEAGLQDLDGDHAHVLVAIIVHTSTADRPSEDPERRRMRISVVRNRGTYTADDLEYIP